jgi:hypothetical protein
LGLRLYTGGTLSYEFAQELSHALNPNDASWIDAVWNALTFEEVATVEATVFSSSRSRSVETGLA